MVILITAFEPFNQQIENASLDVLHHLNFTHSEVTLYRVVLPVIYRSTTYQELLIKYRPDVVLLMGEASGRTKICLEHRAVNMMKASIPDNEGMMYHGEAIDAFGPNESIDTIDSTAIVAKLEPLGYPVALSESAGTFICNLAFYQTLSFVRSLRMNTKVGFLHFPRLTHQMNPINTPSIELEVASSTLASILDYLIMKNENASE